jgi:[ribosomal protein S5]-alanine N-acetyltransferase
MEKLLEQSTSEQQAFLGIEDIEQLQLELTKMKTRLDNAIPDWKKWDIIELNTKKVIGGCGFHKWYIEHERAELGYHLYEAYRGNGYMLEALQPVIKHGFTEMKLNRIEAFTSPDNEPSKTTLKKLGFKQEGILREHFKSGNQIHDSMVFGLLKSELYK